jgi:hypothetical protein
LRLLGVTDAAVAYSTLRTIVPSAVAAEGERKPARLCVYPREKRERQEATASLSYTGQVGERVQDNAVNGRVNWRF